MLRRFTFAALVALPAACAGIFGGGPGVPALAAPPAAHLSPALAQGGAAQPTPTPAASPAKTPAPPKKSPPAVEKGDKLPTAEQVAETVIVTYGGRERLAQIRRSGVERGRLTRLNDEGANEDITYERSFLRGESVEKDKVRLDQKKPSLEYSLIFNEGKVWGLIKGAAFTPRQEEVENFLAQSRHGLDALLRYKENGSALTLVGKEKQKNIDMWVLDVSDKEQRRTRYYISATPDIRKIGRVFWLEYEEAGGGAKPVKFRRTFHDYRVVQGTRVPYHSVLFADDRQVEESQVLTVTYGIKMENSVFTQETEATSTGGA